MINAPPQAPVRPVAVNVTGQADGMGYWSNEPGVQLHNSNWAVAKLVCTCGSEYASEAGIRWEVSSGNIPKDFGRGADISVGPMLVAPGEMLKIDCTGASPGAQVRGQFVGVMASHVSDIIQQYIPAPNPLVVGVSGYGPTQPTPPDPNAPVPFVIQGQSGSS